jgi:ElaB/YqjD/DUF883 family membrane-anchored ribosome-binding protein
MADDPGSTTTFGNRLGYDFTAGPRPSLSRRTSALGQSPRRRYKIILERNPERKLSMEKDIASTRETLINDTTKLKENVGQIAQDVRDHASAHVDFVKGKANDSVSQLVDYARENPLHVVGGAFALGLIVGFALRK